MPATATASPSAVDRLGLDDPAKFKTISRVPILDTHEPIEKTCYDPLEVSPTNPKGLVKRKLRVTRQDLEELARNSGRAVAIGRPPALQIGHSPLDDRPEQFQPKPVGLTSNYQVGDLDGEPVLYADFHLRADQYDEASGYPNISIERVDWRDPEAHRVGAVALLRRDPERPMPMVPYSEASRPARVLYSKERPLYSVDEPLPGEVVRYATIHGISSVVEARRRLLQDKSGYRANYAREHSLAVVHDAEVAAARPRGASRFVDWATRHPGDDIKVLRQKYEEAVAKGLA
jgi:hypothetical protein